MQICFGTTRAVLLTAGYAIKIARVRPVWSVMRLLKYLITGEARTRLVKHHQNPIIAGIRYLLIGFITNRQEARLWRKFGEKAPFVPTLGSYFMGFINIQPRGEKVWTLEVYYRHPFRELLVSTVPEHVRADMTKGENFCRYGGKILLCDYGADHTVALFE